MKNILAFLLLAYSLPVLGQGLNGYNRINLAYVPQYYFNKLYLKNDGIVPNPISTHNTTGHYWNIEFERVTRFGLSVSAGVQYGAQSHNVDITRDLTDFDSEAKKALKGLIYRNNISITTTYIGPRIMVGYHKKMKNNLSLSLKGGVAQKRFYNGLQGGDYITSVTYSTDDDRETRQAGFIVRNASIGRDSASSMRFPSKLNTFEFYAGVEYDLNLGHLRNISVGIEASREWHWNDNVDFIQITSMKSWQEHNSYSYDNYFNRNVCIGLRVAVGIW